MKTEVKARVTAVESNYIKLVALQESLGHLEPGLTVKIVYNDNRKIRKLTQNGLYWLLIHFMLDYLKQEDPTLTAQNLHELVKKLFLPKLVIIKGKGYATTESTTKLSVSDFAAFMDKTMIYFDSLGVPIDLFKAQYQEELERRGIYKTVY